MTGKQMAAALLPRQPAVQGPLHRSGKAGVTEYLLS